VAAAIAIEHARVIRAGAIAQVHESFASLVHVFAGDAVDNAGLPAMPVEHFADLRQPVRAALNAVDQVRPIDRADEYLGIAQSQLLHDIAPHSVRCRGGVGVDTYARQQFSQTAQLTILRAKIVPPDTDAVGLVDGDQRDLPGLKKLDHPVLHEPLG